MPVPPKPNQIPVYLSRVDPVTKSPEFVFDHDKSKEIPPKVPIYMNDTDIAIGTVVTLSGNVLYSEEGDDRGKGYYLYDAELKPIDWVEKLKNSFHIKQSELAGGAQPPSLHTGQVHIDNLVVGNEYEFVIQSLIDTEQRIYRGRLISKTNGTLRITDYTINNGVRQDGVRSFPLEWVRRATILQPVGGGKKKKAKKTKKAKKSKKAKKTGRKSIRRRR